MLQERFSLWCSGSLLELLRLNRPAWSLIISSAFIYIIVLLLKEWSPFFFIDGYGRLLDGLFLLILVVLLLKLLKLLKSCKFSFLILSVFKLFLKDCFPIMWRTVRVSRNRATWSFWGYFFDPRLVIVASEHHGTSKLSSAVLGPESEGSFGVQPGWRRVQPCILTSCADDSILVGSREPERTRMRQRNKWFFSCTCVWCRT